MAKTPKLNFEVTCTQLAATINKLEDEQASLEESLTAFEQGITLVRQAQKALLDAEQRVQLLLETDGDPISTAFVDENVE
jgi:exodeoxyribonuclease VII small subunit